VETGVGTGERKSQRREEVKARLRTALQDLAVDHSFRDVTVVEITSAAGLSRSAFYFYYKDKRDLLIESVKRMSDTTFDLTTNQFSAEDRSAAIVHRVLVDNAAAWQRHAALLRIVIEASVYDQDVNKFWTALIGDFIRALIERLLADQSDDRIPQEVDVAVCADFLVTGTMGFFYRRISQGAMPPEDAAAAIEPIWVRVLYS
jgi:TetR/AcrR family transcriptional regulator, ethionamide resistance regulator